MIKHDSQDSQRRDQLVPSAEFERFAPTVPILSSLPLGWPHLLVRTYSEPQSIERIAVPATPDPFIAVCFRGDRSIEGRDGDGPWHSAHIATPCVFIRSAGEPAELTWRSRRDEPVETAHLHLSSRVLQKVADEAADRNPGSIQIINRFAFHDPVIETVASALVAELRGSHGSAALYAEAAAQFLAVHLLRRHCSAALPVTRPKGTLDAHRLRRVLDRIHDNPERPVTLHELAELAGLSVFHFSRLFKNTTGHAPHRYVVRQRIEAACHFLRDSRHGIADVAYAVGFQSVSQFTAQFARHMGISPAAFRRSVRTAKSRPQESS
jgi:AraC family transcriptional regulator